MVGWDCWTGSDMGFVRNREGCGTGVNGVAQPLYHEVIAFPAGF
jgi:hypothetical protein